MLDVIDWLSNPVVAGLVSAGILAFISFAFGAPIRRWWSKVGPRLTAPRADLKSFSILVANLEGDDQLHSTRGLIESLERLSGVEVYRLEQSLPAWPAGSTREGRERTHLYVREILVKRHRAPDILSLITASAAHLIGVCSTPQLRS
jgi:hypothetical protein